MLRNLLVGIPVMVLCLILQATLVTFGLKQYARFNQCQTKRASRLRNIMLLSMVMLLMSLSNFVQMVIWAGLFILLGEFDQASIALYFSAVTFATLGYGDIVMSEHWRLLGPLEATNGILMFGVSTAVMTAAVIDVVKNYTASLDKDERT